MGIFAAGSPFENAMKDSAKAEAERNKTSMWDNTINTLFQVGVVAPTARAIASEVGTAINKSSVEKHLDWLQSEEVAQLKKVNSDNRKAKSAYLLDEDQRIASKLDERSWVRQNIAKNKIEALKIRLQTPQPNDVDPRVVMGDSKLKPLDPSMYTNAQLEAMIKPEIEKATDNALRTRQEMGKFIGDIKTEEQFKTMLTRKNPYSKSFLGNLLGLGKNTFTGKTREDIEEAAIKNITESEFYISSLNAQQAVKDYQLGQNFQKTQEKIRDVVLTAEALDNVSFKFLPTTETEVKQTISADGERVNNYIIERVVDPTDKTTKSRQIFTGSDELPVTDKQKLKDFPSFNKYIDDLNLSDPARNKFIAYATEKGLDIANVDQNTLPQVQAANKFISNLALDITNYKSITKEKFEIMKIVANQIAAATFNRQTELTGTDITNILNTKELIRNLEHSLVHTNTGTGYLPLVDSDGITTKNWTKAIPLGAELVREPSSSVDNPVYTIDYTNVDPNNIRLFNKLDAQLNGVSSIEVETVPRKADGVLTKDNTSDDDNTQQGLLNSGASTNPPVDNTYVPIDNLPTFGSKTNPTSRYSVLGGTREIKDALPEEEEFLRSRKANYMLGPNYASLLSPKK